MIILDASAAVEWLLRTAAGQVIENRIYSRSETLHAPQLFDLEVVQVLRRLERERIVARSRCHQALQDLLLLRLTRYPHLLFLPRVWQYRHNMSAYDAAYIALAEQLGAPLITRDQRLASAKGHSAVIEVF